MLSFSFYLIKSSSLKSEKRIYLYVRDNKNTLTLPTDVKVQPEAWNVKKQAVKSNHPLATVYNNYLNKFKQRVQAIAFNLLNDKNATFDEIASVIKDYLEKKDNVNLFDALDKFISVRSAELSTSMINKFKTLKAHLIEFQKLGNEVSFTALNTLFLTEFANHLINKNLTNNTVNKYIELILTFARWCNKNKIANIQVLEKPKIRGFSDFIVALNIAEIKRIIALDLNGITDKVRDIFVFACLTGARFSDVINLKQADVKGDTWYLITKKTLDKIPIKLPSIALEILHKYNFNLPKIHNQVVNKEIKKICQLAGIDEQTKSFKLQGNKRLERVLPKYQLISFHTARRSYITNLRALGVDIETIMAQSGHKRLEVFKRYSTTDNERINTAITRLNEVFIN